MSTTTMQQVSSVPTFDMNVNDEYQNGANSNNNSSSNNTSAGSTGTGSGNEEDPSKIEDANDRRRFQNRIAQRKYRSKLRRRLNELEKRMTMTNGTMQMPVLPDDQQHQGPMGEPMQNFSGMPNGMPGMHGDHLNQNVNWTKDVAPTSMPQQHSPALSELPLSDDQLNGAYNFGSPLWGSPQYMPSPPHQFMPSLPGPAAMPEQFMLDANIPRSMGGMNGFYAEPSPMVVPDFSRSSPPASIPMTQPQAPTSVPTSISTPPLSQYPDTPMAMKSGLDSVKAHHKHSRSTGSLTPQPGFPSPTPTPQPSSFPRSFPNATSGPADTNSSPGSDMMLSDLSDFDSDYEDHREPWNMSSRKRPRAFTDPKLMRSKTIPLGSNLPGQSSNCTHNYESTTLETRFQHIFTCMREAGFDSFDDMVSQYYTADFLDTSSAHLAQKTSRGRKLPGVMADLRNSARDWTRWEAQGYEDEIIKSAESLYMGELDHLGRSRERKRARKSRDTSGSSLGSPDQMDSLWSSLTDQMMRGVPAASVISESKKTFQNELPNLWALLAQLADSPGPSGASHNGIPHDQSRVVLAAISMLHYSKSVRLPELWPWIDCCLQGQEGQRALSLGSGGDGSVNGGGMNASSGPLPNQFPGNLPQQSWNAQNGTPVQVAGMSTGLGGPPQQQQQQSQQLGQVAA